jgi:glucosamine-6-phosphate isomerase
MQVNILQNYREMSQNVAQIMIDYVKKKPEAIICIASGDTPLGLCKMLVDAQNKKEIDFKEVTFVGLDEWVGMGSMDEGSCQYFLRTELFKPLKIRPKQIIQFDAKAADIERECDRINNYIANKGGLDIMVVGVGLNGHIGLNEPGTSFDTFAHVSHLADSTITVGQKYFNRPTPLSKGITLGLKHLSNSILPILIASGEKKSQIIKQSLQCEISENIPASIFQTIDQSLVFLDEDAAKLLSSQ